MVTALGVFGFSCSHVLREERKPLGSKIVLVAPLRFELRSPAVFAVRYEELQRPVLKVIVEFISIRLFPLKQDMLDRLALKPIMYRLREPYTTGLRLV
jgi:hypothetical protein